MGQRIWDGGNGSELKEIIRRRQWKRFFVGDTNNTWIQFFRYCFVGGAATIVDWGISSLLFYFLFHQEYAVLANGLSFVAGLAANYCMSTFWIFRNSKIQSRWMEFLAFAAIGVVGLLLTLGITKLFEIGMADTTSIYQILSKIVSTGTAFLWNFFARKYWLYRDSDQKKMMHQTFWNMTGRTEQTGLYRSIAVCIAVCLGCTVLTWGDAERVSCLSAGILMTGLCIVLLSLVLRETGMRRRVAVPCLLGAGLVGVSSAVCVHFVSAVAVLSVGGVLLTAVVWCSLEIWKKCCTRYRVFLLLVLGFWMRFCYVLYTAVTQRQHDVGDFVEMKGHSGYILYLYENAHLPDFDVREVWQFYHPPLHHAICAVWLKFWSWFGITGTMAYESLQMLTLCYSVITMVLGYGILRQFRLNKNGLVLATAILALHPTFFLLAGSVNNDMLALLFFIGTLYTALQWYREPNWKRIFPVALCLGLGMSAKLSVWMAALPVALLFVAYFFQKKGRQKLQCCGQYLLFLGVCTPLALWWSIRNGVQYGVPVTYVPSLKPTSVQYVGMRSTWQRLLDFSWIQFRDVSMQFEMYDGAYYEWNPTVGLWKTAMFDELISDRMYPAIHIPAIVLFWTAVVLSLLALAAMLRLFLRHRNALRWQRYSMLLLAVAQLISYYVFCFQFPYTCTQNIRYVVPLIFLGALALGTFCQKWRNRRGLRQWSVRILQGITVLFSIHAVLVYTIVACYGV